MIALYRCRYRNCLPSGRMEPGESVHLIFFDMEMRRLQFCFSYDSLPLFFLLLPFAVRCFLSTFFPPSLDEVFDPAFSAREGSVLFRRRATLIVNSSACRGAGAGRRGRFFSCRYVDGFLRTGKWKCVSRVLYAISAERFCSANNNETAGQRTLCYCLRLYFYRRARLNLFASIEGYF